MKKEKHKSSIFMKSKKSKTKQKAKKGDIGKHMLLYMYFFQKNQMYVKLLKTSLFTALLHKRPTAKIVTICQKENFRETLQYNEKEI